MEAGEACDRLRSSRNPGTSVGLMHRVARRYGRYVAERSLAAAPTDAQQS